ncbi:MAG: Narbonolide/10-deoxymethynolide synthase PikA2, modules 3 and 4 [Turneriella sp.]|nr:Narbonolide/10-deoxymethynolide synthase PikA2, modules 3 and 4 [Turneriella sp.]
MKAIPFKKASGPENLTIEEWVEPRIEPHQILIQVRAFGVNFADIFARKGEYGDAPRFPFVPGYEVSGVVSKVGDKVTKFRVGDEVIALTRFGGYAEYAVADARATVIKPESLSFVDGASIPVNFLTAYHALFETGTFVKDAKVLIHAGAGGVGLAAIQLAKERGAVVFATAGSESKLNLLREYAVDYPINYRTHDYEQEILSLTRGEKLDIVLDSVGGSYFKKDLNLLRSHGRVVAYGASAFTDRSIFRLPTILPQLFSMLTLSMVDLMSQSHGFYGVNMLRVAEENPALLQSEFVKVMELFAAKKIQSVVSQQLSWRKIKDAHEALEGRQSTGKIVMVVD